MHLDVGMDDFPRCRERNREECQDNRLEAFMKTGFDIQRYMQEQSKFILERVAKYDKLYLEFGGKLLYDLHAKRVLPGFRLNTSGQSLW